MKKTDRPPIILIYRSGYILSKKELRRAQCGRELALPVPYFVFVKFYFWICNPNVGYPIKNVPPELETIDRTFLELPDDGLKDGMKGGMKNGLKLNKIQQEILSAILKDRNITREALAEKVGISVRNIEKNIARLKKEAILERIGSRKTGYWEIESTDIQTKTAHEKTGSEEVRKLRS